MRMEGIQGMGKQCNPGRRKTGRKFVCLLAAVTMSLPALPGGFAGTASASRAYADEVPQAMTQERIDAANDAYNDVPAALSFVTMSDTEFAGSATETQTSQEVAYGASVDAYLRIADWADAKGFEAQAVVVNGDVVGANEAEYNAHQKGDSEKAAGWYRAAEQVLVEAFGSDPYYLFTQGNHDIADLMGEVFDEKHASDEKWFYPNDDTGDVSNLHTEINGYDFILLDYNGENTFGYTGQRSGYQDYLRQTLAEMAAAPDYDPGKPIFVQIHSGYSNTSLGGPFHQDYDTAGADLAAILKDYPQVLVGSAHTHFSVEPETSIYQKDFTYYENGSMNYIYQDVPADFLGGGYFNDGQGSEEMKEKTCNFISVLEDGSTVIRRFDVTHERWIGMPWVIDTTQGKDGFRYTDDQRSTVGPWWEEGAVAKATAVTETSAVLGFDQAVDDELVNYYEVELFDAAGNPVSFQVRQVPNWGNTSPESFTGSFKAFSRWYMEPDTMGFEVTGLDPATTYRMRVTAYDDFQNASSAALETTFRTAGELTFPELPDATLPDDIDEGKYLEMNFEGTLKDALGGASGAATGDVSYVESYASSRGSAVRIGSGAGSYVDLGQRDEWNLSTDGDMTASFWIKVDQVSGYSAFLSNKNWTNWWRSGINVGPEGSDATKVEFTLGDGTDGSGGVYCTGEVGDYRGEWHMMTFTVDRENQRARTYFDGELKATTDIGSVGDMTSGLNMYLGVDAGLKYGASAFSMDDLQMWDRPLSEEDVAALYASTDIRLVREALDDAVAYAQELKAIMEANAQNGQVYDEGLTAALDAAMAAAQEAADENIRDAFYALKDACEAVEGQEARYVVRATGEHGSVTPQTEVAELGSDVTFDLLPDEGYQVEGATVDVTGAASWEIAGSQLVAKDVTGAVDVRVVFAEADAGEPGDGDGGSSEGSGEPGDSGSGAGGGDGTGTDGSGTDGTGTDGSGDGSPGSDAGDKGDAGDGGDLQGEDGVGADDQADRDSGNGSTSGVLAKTGDAASTFATTLACVGLTSAGLAAGALARRKMRR